jgi:hypothetical protein
MTVKIPSIILNSDGSRSLNKPSFDITFSGTAETKKRCNMFSLLRYLWLALSRADENVMSNRSAKIGVKDNRGSSKGTFGGKFDQLMQNLNNAETNGIVIGPEFSRIFAEIILQRIDRNVIEILKKDELFHKDHYEIFRYVDDYFVFFNETSTRDKILKAYRLQLMEYKLHVNESKIVPYTKPIITQITIAKQRIVDLFDKYLAYKIENTANEGGVKGSIYVSSNRLITKFKTIIKETQVEYKDILNYTLAVVEQKTYRILRDYKRLDKTQSESEEGLINAIMGYALHGTGYRM